MILTVNGISFRYKSADALKDINFEIGRNEVVSILGPNGAGKSTLLKCINGILKPYKGLIFMDGKNMLKFSRKQTAKSISYVPQRSDSSMMTVFDSVLLGRRPHIMFDASDRDLKIVQSMIDRLDLGNIALHYTDSISGGEYQKVTIARALVQEPKIMLLDEPTANLDLKNQQEILNLIKDISKFHEVSAVMSAHDINTALRYSDRIIFLKKGIIYAQVSPEDVTPEIIENVYGVKVNVMEFDSFRHVFPL